MSVESQVDEITDAVKVAARASASAYDKLVDELGQDPPNPAEVLAQSGKLWTSSLKAWAQLVLAPGAIAEAIVNDDGQA